MKTKIKFHRRKCYEMTEKRKKLIKKVKCYHRNLSDKVLNSWSDERLENYINPLDRENNETFE